MFTRSGWLTLFGAAIAAALARTFAITELWVVAAGLAALAVLALLWVRGTAVRVRLHRTVTPLQIYAGDSGRIQISAVNAGSSATPVLELHDPVAGTRGAQLQLAPLGPGGEATAAYRLPTGRRGIVSVGPLRLEITDPFGLARRRALAAGTMDITVYPHLEPIGLPSLGGENDPHGGAARSNAMALASDELFALRPYEQGDDLRRVHWKSTARTGELVVRQDESPWQHRTTVALDVRLAAYSDDSFERAVSTAASVVNAAFRDRHVVRFYGSMGADSGSAAGAAHLGAILDHLAIVSVDREASLRSMVAAVRSTTDGNSDGGVCVVVCGSLTAAELQTIAELTRRFKRVIVAVHGGEVPAVATSSRLVVVGLTAGQPLTEAWTAALGSSARIAMVR